MRRSRLLLLGGVGVALVAGSLGVSSLRWLGVGLVYLLVAATVTSLNRAEKPVEFRHGVGVGVVAVLLTAVLTGIWKAAPYSPGSVAFWDVVVSYTFRTVIVAAVVPISLSTTRWQYLGSGAPIPLLVGIDIAESIRSSMPYEGELTIAAHFWSLLLYAVQISVEGLLFGIPLYVVLRGVPPTVDQWLSADGDTGVEHSEGSGRR